jgi:hypothetical protein
MTDVVRIENIVVDLPIDPAVLAAARAVDACGHWPTVATEAEYRAATDHAGRELGRAAEVWRRYCRRFNQLYSPIERAPSRLRTRYFVASQLFEQRIEVTRLLVDGPAAGRA